MSANVCVRGVSPGVCVCVCVERSLHILARLHSFRIHRSYAQPPFIHSPTRQRQDQASFPPPPTHLSLQRLHFAKGATITYYFTWQDLEQQVRRVVRRRVDLYVLSCLWNVYLRIYNIFNANWDMKRVNFLYEQKAVNIFVSFESLLLLHLLGFSLAKLNE